MIKVQRVSLSAAIHVFTYDPDVNERVEVSMTPGKERTRKYVGGLH